MHRFSLRKMIALVVTVSCFTMFFGGSDVMAVTNDEAYAGSQLQTLGILKGYPDGQLHLDWNITRAEVATLGIRILGYENAVVAGTPLAFSDMTGHWAYSNVRTASIIDIVHGYPDGSFKPDNNISYAEVVAIMVNALGYQDSLEGSWPDNYLNKAMEIGIVTEDTLLPANKIVTRGEMAILVYYTIIAEM